MMGRSGVEAPALPNKLVRRSFAAYLKLSMNYILIDVILCRLLIRTATLTRRTSCSVDVYRVFFFLKGLVNEHRIDLILDTSIRIHAFLISFLFHIAYSSLTCPSRPRELKAVCQDSISRMNDSHFPLRRKFNALCLSK